MTYRVCVVRSKIDGLELHECLGIDAMGTVIRPISVPGLIEKSFIANTNEVVRIKTLDVCANFFCPFVDQG